MKPTDQVRVSPLWPDLAKAYPGIGRVIDAGSSFPASVKVQWEKGEPLWVNPECLIVVED